MVRLCLFVVGQRGIKSPSIWSRIWLQPRTPVACIANDFGLRRFFRIRRVAASICTNRIFPDPQRLSRLLIAVCLAYIWIVYLGSVCTKEGWVSIIHRHHRCDLSLFQLGLRLLEHFLNEELPIPVAFHIFI